MANTRRHRIRTVDGTVEFVGKELVNKTATIRLHKRKRAKLTVTVYVTKFGDGVIRQNVRLGNVLATFVDTVHAGTSPEWLRPDQSTALLDTAWREACEAEPLLRPVRVWRLKENFVEARLPTGRNTYLRIRTRHFD